MRRDALAGNATDKLVCASIAVRETRSGFTIVRCPDRADFWFANCLVLDSVPARADYDHWVRMHAETFRGVPVQRRVVQWETSERASLPAYSGPIERQRLTVFTARSAPVRNTGIAAIRAFASDRDWDDALALQNRELAETGRDDQSAFHAWRFNAYRRDAAEHRCRTWGAWQDDRLLSFAGLYANDEWTRFFNPLTEPDFRGRGLFGAIAATALGETLRAHPNATAVIVAETGSAAERTYETLGFHATGEQHALIAAV